MELSKLNILAILVAAVATFLLGGLWYSPILFAKRWALEAGLTDEQQRSPPMARIFGFSLLAALPLSRFPACRGGSLQHGSYRTK